MAKAGARKAGQATQRTDYETPAHIFSLLDDLLWAVTGKRVALDVCASAANKKAWRFFDTETDGLSRNWDFPWFCNWPYSRDGNLSWSAKCVAQGQRTPGVALFPTNSDDTSWAHAIFRSAAVVICFEGRIHFELDGVPQKSPDFGNKAAIWLGRKYHGLSPRMIYLSAKRPADFTTGGSLG